MNKFLLIFAFALLMKPVFPVVNFIVNHEYIAKVLCENKTKPKLECNGKCYLKKELAKASENTNPASQDKKQIHQESEILFLETITLVSFSNARLKNTAQINHGYSNQYSHLSNHSIFHPPTVS